MNRCITVKIRRHFQVLTLPVLNLVCAYANAGSAH